MEKNWNNNGISQEWVPRKTVTYHGISAHKWQMCTAFCDADNDNADDDDDDVECDGDDERLKKCTNVLTMSNECKFLIYYSSNKMATTNKRNEKKEQRARNLELKNAQYDDEYDVNLCLYIEINSCTLASSPFNVEILLRISGHVLYLCLYMCMI